MPITRNAQCCCGQLRLAAEGNPLRISVCHCLACQRRTGSIFGVQARFPENLVAVSGKAKQYIRVADSGAEVTHNFCPDCGSTVYYRLAAVPGMVGVPVGGFTDPDFPPPVVSIYAECRHKWMNLPGDIEQQ